MSEWEFLHDMNAQGCSKDEILDAMSSGATQEEWATVERMERKQEREKLKVLRDSGQISPYDFKKRKSEIF